MIKVTSSNIVAEEREDHRAMLLSVVIPVTFSGFYAAGNASQTKPPDYRSGFDVRIYRIITLFSANCV